MSNEVHIRKCQCGDPICNQYTLSTQGSVGFLLEDATLYAAAPDLLEALIRLEASSAWAATPKGIRALIDAAITKATGASNG